MSKKDPDLLRWQPDLSPEAREHVERLRAELEPRIAFMREFRKTLGLTQSEVAEVLGVTQSNVSKIEAKGDPPLSALARIAEAKGWRLWLGLESPDGKERASFVIE